MAQHIKLGKAGEDLAAAYLVKNGFVVLEKNWRFQKAEVDIIAVADNFLVVIEVKTRSTNYFGAPEESINKNKRKLLCEAANAYLEMNQLNYEIRFDVISVISENGDAILNHITDAFYPFANE